MERALVVGASGGIGAAIAQRLSGAGYGMALLDLDAERIGRTAAEIRSKGHDVWSGSVDVREPASVEAALDAVEAELGPVNALVTAAGIIKKEAFLELELAAWERTLSVNLTGTWLMMQRVARRMVARGGTGAFVALSSVAGRGPRALPAAGRPAGPACRGAGADDHPRPPRHPDAALAAFPD